MFAIESVYLCLRCLLDSLVLRLSIRAIESNGKNVSWLIFSLSSKGAISSVVPE